MSVQTCLLLVTLKLSSQANCMSYKPITIDYEGPCCNSECPDEDEEPFCGSDGVTYGNKCLLDYVSCYWLVILPFISCWNVAITFTQTKGRSPLNLESKSVFD